MTAGDGSRDVSEGSVNELMDTANGRLADQLLLNGGKSLEHPETEKKTLRGPAKDDKQVGVVRFL